VSPPKFAFIGFRSVDRLLLLLGSRFVGTYSGGLTAPPLPPPWLYPANPEDEPIVLSMVRVFWPAYDGHWMFCAPPMPPMAEIDAPYDGFGTNELPMLAIPLLLLFSLAPMVLLGVLLEALLGS
jgi:hypothetical protein